MAESMISFDAHVIDGDRAEQLEEMERLYEAVMAQPRSFSMRHGSTDKLIETHGTTPRVVQAGLLIDTRSTESESTRPRQHVLRADAPSSAVRAIHPLEYRTLDQRTPPALQPADRGYERLRQTQQMHGHELTPDALGSRTAYDRGAIDSAGDLQKNLKSRKGCAEERSALSTPTPTLPTPESVSRREQHYTKAASKEGRHGKAQPASFQQNTGLDQQILPLRELNYRFGLHSQQMPQGSRIHCLSEREDQVRGSSASDRMFRTTVVESRLNMQGPMHTGQATPYSPYMPFTPLTPVTPRLLSRAERKHKYKEERANRRAITEEDIVADDEELWGVQC